VPVGEQVSSELAEELPEGGPVSGSDTGGGDCEGCVAQVEVAVVAAEAD